MERLKAVQVVTSLLGCPQRCRFVAIFILGEAKCKKFLQFFLLNLDKKIFTAPSVEGGGGDTNFSSRISRSLNFGLNLKLIKFQRQLRLVSTQVQVFLNGPTPASFSFISVFSKLNYKFYNTQVCEKCPSGIWCQDSNSQPLEHESPAITNRPRLSPIPRYKFDLVHLELVLLWMLQ